MSPPLQLEVVGSPRPDPDAVRVRLDLGYDGTGFAGWARQPGQRTVAGLLEEALATILRVPVALTVAGRTDAGVHAVGQVAHLDVPTGALVRAGPRGADRVDDKVLARLTRRLAGVLPPDVRVRRAAVAPDGFDARFSALYRRYAYRITDAIWGVDPLRRTDTLGWPRPLDVAAMDRAGTGLLGEHDFAAYCRRREGASTIRALLELSCRRGADGVITVTVRADAFCHQMVRSLVGALVGVGDGRRSVDWPAGLLERTVRAQDVPVLPAKGLTLTEVGYPPDGDLAARVAVTRRRRG